MKQAVRVVLVAALSILAAACSFGELSARRLGDAGGDAQVADAGDASDARDASTWDASAPAADADTDAQGAADASGDASAGDADTAHDASDANTASSVLELSPLTSLATDWNDYALDPTWFTIDACSFTPVDQKACVQLGARRVVVVPGETCSGNGVLTVQDSLQAFDWTCSDGGGAGPARFEGRPKPSTRLIDLLDVAQLAFRANTITLLRDGTQYFVSEPAVFWDNPVLAPPSALGGSVTLDVSGAIYVFAVSPNADIVIAADDVTLVAAPGVVLSSPTTNAPLLRTTGGTRKFVQIEGLTLELGTRPLGVDLELTYGHVRGLHATRSASQSGAGPDVRIVADGSVLTELSSDSAFDVGLDLSGFRVDLADIEVTRAGGDGIVFGLTEVWVDGLRVSRTGGVGLRMRDQRGVAMRDVAIDRTAATGLLAQGIDGLMVQHLRVANAGIDGLRHENSPVTSAVGRGSVFYDVIATNNDETGVVLGGENSRLTRAIVASNAVDGVRVVGDSHVVQHVTAVDNGKAGVRVTTNANRNTLVDIVSANNAGGLWLEPSSYHTHVHDLVAVDGSMNDVWVQGEENEFTGVLKITALDRCSVTAGLTSPGLDATSNCAAANASTATVEAIGSSASFFAGQLAQKDPANAEPVVSPFTRSYQDIGDWLTFSVPERAWGLYGAVAFPHASYAGRCVGTDVPCAVFDYRVGASGQVRNVLGNPPTGLDAALAVVTHSWSAATQQECMFARGTWNTGDSTCTSAFYAAAFSPEYFIAGWDAQCGPTLQGSYCVLNRNRGAYPGAGDTSGWIAVDSGAYGTASVVYFLDNAP